METLAIAMHGVSNITVDFYHQVSMANDVSHVWLRIWLCEMSTSDSDKPGQTAVWLKLKSLTTIIVKRIPICLLIALLLATVLWQMFSSYRNSWQQYLLKWAKLYSSHLERYYSNMCIKTTHSGTWDRFEQQFHLIHYNFNSLKQQMLPKE